MILSQQGEYEGGRAGGEVVEEGVNVGEGAENDEEEGWRENCVGEGLEEEGL